MKLKYAPANRDELIDRCRAHLRTIQSAIYQGERQFDDSQGLKAIVRIAPRHGEADSFTITLSSLSLEAVEALDQMIKFLDDRDNTAQLCNRSDIRGDVPREAWRPGGVAKTSTLAHARIEVAVWSADTLQAHAAATSLLGQLEMLLAAKVKADSTPRPGELGGVAANPAHESARARAGEPVAVGGGA